MATSRIGILLVLHLSLQLFLASCSLSYAQRGDDPAFDRKEARGNLTFGCSSPGPCIPCSYSEKNDEDTYRCSASGYRQSYRCIELSSSTGVKGMPHNEKIRTRKLSSVGKSSHFLSEENPDRKLHLTIRDEHQFLHLYFSCLPTDTDEKLTVWGFEAIMLGLIGVTAPVIYHKRRRNYSMTGMTRLPTSVRF